MCRTCKSLLCVVCTWLVACCGKKNHKHRVPDRKKVQKQDRRNPAHLKWTLRAWVKTAHLRDCLTTRVPQTATTEELDQKATVEEDEDADEDEDEDEEAMANEVQRQDLQQQHQHQYPRRRFVIMQCSGSASVLRHLRVVTLCLRN